MRPGFTNGADFGVDLAVFMFENNRRLYLGNTSFCMAHWLHFEGAFGILMQVESKCR